MPDALLTTWTWEDYLGRKQTRQVSQTVVDIQKFEGTAVYPYLLMAANPAMSYTDMLTYLRRKGCPRSQSWLRRRRWMLGPDFAPQSGAKVNADGQDERAIQIMQDKDNVTLSAARLANLLGEYGIRRSREWVRGHRCVRLTDN